MEQTPEKHDQDKLRLELVPISSIEAAARAFTYGAVKYADYNYASGEGLDPERLVGALLRHLNELRKGVTHDPESKLHHMDHVLACAMMYEVQFKRRTAPGQPL